MSSAVVLIVLVVAAVLVSAAQSRVGPKVGPAAGGTVYLVLGAALGPRALGLIESDTLPTLRPVLHVACGLLGLVFGLRQRRRHLLRLGPRGLLALLAEWGVTALLLAAALRPALGAVFPWSGPVLDPGAPRLSAAAAVDLAALGSAALCAASGPGLLRWARRSLGAKGPLTDRGGLFGVLAESDVLLTFLSLVLLVSLLPPAGAATPPGVPRGLFAPLCGALLGPLLGGAFTLLAGRRPERDTAWVLLIGVLLLGAGLASRLGLPAMVVCYLLGATIAASTDDHALLDEIALQTREPVEVLVLLFCGLYLSPAPALLLPCGAVVLARSAGKLLAGAAALPAAPSAARAALPVSALRGLALLGFGAVPLCAALQLQLLYGGLVGEAALLLGAVTLVAGDLFGSFGLRALLHQAGELPAEPPPCASEAP